MEIIFYFHFSFSPLKKVCLQTEILGKREDDAKFCKAQQVNFCEKKMIFLYVRDHDAIKLFDHFHSLRNILFTFIVSLKYLEIATL